MPSSTPWHTLGAALVAALGFAALWWLHTNPDFARTLFDLGNVLGMNDQTGLTQARATEILRHLKLALLGVASLAGLVATDGIAGRIATSRPKLARTVRAVVPFATVLAVVVVIAVRQTIASSFVLNGRRYFCLLDDAMNSMRYALNLVEGTGLAYNPGERVEGYTNFLWVLVMAAIHWLGAGVADAPAWVLGISWACLGVTAALAMDLVRAAGADRTWTLCAGLLVVCDENAVVWASSGLETTALTAAVAVCAWALVHGRPRVLATALVVLALVRADGIVLAAPIACLACFTRERRPSAKQVVLPLVAAFLGHVVFRRVYYGDWLPNTYYLRMIGAADRLKIGAGGYGLRLAAGYSLWLVLATAAVASRRIPGVFRWLVAFALGYIAYAIWLGGDIFCGVRFVVPVLPLLSIGAVVLLQKSLVGTAAQRTAQVLVLAMSSAVMSYGALAKSLVDRNHILATFGLGRMLEKNLPSGSSISIYPAGTLPYYANRFRYVDIFGKNDRHLAHLDHYVGQALGHNKLDFDYVYDQRKVDVAFIIGPCAHLAAEAARQRPEVAGRPSELAPWQRDMTHPTFAASYLPNQVRYVGVASPTATECLFVREGRDIPLFWSSAGPPERASSVRLECDDRDEHKRAALGPGWLTSGALRARSTCSLAADRAGIVDLWVVLDRPARLELCESSAGALTLTKVNATEIPLDATTDPSCAGTLWRGEVPVSVLGTNRNVTRVQVAAGSTTVALDWLRWVSP